tara:strand:+ start:1185 stop:1337 length:153 start_codon:yes stop_codon:yes gene_type:complete
MLSELGLILTALGFLTGAAGAYWRRRWAMILGASVCFAGVALVTLAGAIP